jgi:hypothetical protein
MEDRSATNTTDPASSELPEWGTEADILRHRQVIAALKEIRGLTEPTWPAILKPDLSHASAPAVGESKLHHAIAMAAAAATRVRADPVKLGWAAGFFDADGHIGAPTQTYGPYANGRPRQPSMRLVAVITQNVREVLEHFRDVVGAHGKIYCLKRNIGQNRQCYNLVFDGRHALEVIYLLRPDLHRKQYEADTARELAIRGKLGMHPGPKGFPADVQRARKALQRKLRRLK